MIEQIPNAENMTAEEILSWLTAPRRDRLPTAEAMWSYAGIAERFGLPVAETIYQAIIAAGLTGLATRFASLGLDAGDPQWEQQADALAAQVPALAGVAGEIRDLGYDTRPQWQVLGLTEEPTLAIVQQWKADAATKETVIYDQRHVLLSVNLSPSRAVVSFRIMGCATVDGKEIDGPVVATIATARAGDDQRFAGLLAEIRKLTEAV
jgi:hypothetical protein